MSNDWTPKTCICFTSKGKCLRICGLPINAPNNIKPARPNARKKSITCFPKAEIKLTIIQTIPSHNLALGT